MSKLQLPQVLCVIRHMQKVKPPHTLLYAYYRVYPLLQTMPYCRSYPLLETIQSMAPIREYTPYHYVSGRITYICGVLNFVIFVVPKIYTHDSNPLHVRTQSFPDTGGPYICPYRRGNLSHRETLQGPSSTRIYTVGVTRVRII